jgi:hypothetical protein
MTLSTTEILDQLQQASSGLLYMSESDYPFEVFFWVAVAPMTPETVLKQTGHPQDTPVEVVEFDRFFRSATTPEDWHTAEEQETVAKYRALVETLKANLSNLEVYRLGTIEIDVYIVGQTPTGYSAGLSTKVVET